MTERPAIPQGPVGAGESSTHAQPAASPVPAPLTADQRRATIQLARALAADTDGAYFATHNEAVQLALLVTTLLDRANSHVMPLYSAALDWARAIRDGRPAHQEHLATRAAAIAALEMERE